jgi:mannose-6-phosphate isomerase-like protein (cupin superfamily)
MRLERADSTAAKGWYAGPWNAPLAVSVGYATTGIDEPHAHTRITEIYLIARGTAVMRVERQDVALEAGDMLMLEPGEAHTFISNSPDYFHFVIHTPGLAGEEARAEKQGVPRERLGLPESDAETPETVTLYRPTGEKELALIRASGYAAFPPRLLEQPIFYPVLTEEYAAQIARDWNARDGHMGYVTRFRVRADFLAGYEVHTVGSAQHRENWIPAGDLDAFNRALVGLIEVIAEFRSGGR